MEYARGWKPTLTVVAALICVCAAPSVASAANRYAEPTGDGAEPCAQSDPCDIETAVNDADRFDDITLLPGTYTTTVTLGLRSTPASPAPTRPRARTRTARS